jgi:hypothetical protein
MAEEAVWGTMTLFDYEFQKELDDEVSGTGNL